MFLTGLTVVACSILTPMNYAESQLLQINIDNLSLFKSSSKQFWPILGRIVESFLSEPFVIGLNRLMYILFQIISLVKCKI